jgi:RNA polymerase primary sigma factor
MMRETPITADYSLQATTVVRKINPTSKLPTVAALRRLAAEERERLERILSEPQECVYHPAFRRGVMPGANLQLPAISYPTEGQPTEVLSADQERTLFLKFNYCRYRIMRVLAKFRAERLTAAACRELLYWDQLATEARGEIVRLNTSLVLAMARRSRNNGVELGELVSEGNLALLRCVDKFDAARGFKFSTYACRAILASFSRAGAKAARHRSQFPTPYDPAMERSDFLESKRTRIEHECVDELKRILFENSADLSTVERRVLAARFSLDQAEPGPGARRKTLDQVGDLLGVSKERVRQIQNQAMIKLRAVLEERLLAAS